MKGFPLDKQNKGWAESILIGKAFICNSKCGGYDMTNDRQKLWTAIISATITAAITVGVPAIIESLKPEETVHVVLQDLREKDPQKYEEYIQSEILNQNQVIMDTADQQLTLNGSPVSAYLLGNEKYVSLSDVIQNSSGIFVEGEDGAFITTPQKNGGEKQEPRTGTNWLEQCMPYELGNFELCLEREGKEFCIAGQIYNNGLVCDSAWDSNALFNLDGKFETLYISIGHVDGSDMQDGTFNFYVDNTLVKTVKIKAEDLIGKYEIPLNYGKHLKIENKSTISYAKFGFTEGTFIP